MLNQRGFVTTEFLFAIIIAFGMTLVTFALTFTLSTVEVAQYVTFSASRAHAAGNYDAASQKKQAQLKYDELMGNSEIAPLFTNGWFKISKSSDLEIRSGSGDNFEKDYPVAQGSGRGTHQGVRMNLAANILEMRLPLLGNITPDGDGFKTKLSALLIREPSQQECYKYMELRKDALFDNGNFENRFTRFKKSGNVPIPWEDNAC